MRVLITGATGLVGSALSAALVARGDEVRVLSRRGGEGRFHWDPAAGRLDAAALEGCDAVVHLAGRSVLTRWTAGARHDIRESRVRGGELLAEAIASMGNPPAVYVTSSAIGIYGSRGDESLDESSSAGSGFLSDLAVAWEGVAEPLAPLGVRAVAVRTGLVLRSLVRPLKLPFSLALGAQLGNGRQWMSWIHLEDLVACYLHVLDREDLAGAFNAVAPEPVTNAEFTQSLGRTLHRPAFLRVPAFALRLLAGSDFADETLLASQRVVPERLLVTGFTFRWTRLGPALEDLMRG